jgi:hypothetical protein
MEVVMHKVAGINIAVVAIRKSGSDKDSSSRCKDTAEKYHAVLWRQMLNNISTVDHIHAFDLIVRSLPVFGEGTCCAVPVPENLVRMELQSLSVMSNDLSNYVQSDVELE